MRQTRAVAALPAEPRHAVREGLGVPLRQAFGRLPEEFPQLAGADLPGRVLVEGVAEEVEPPVGRDLARRLFLTRGAPQRGVQLDRCAARLAGCCLTPELIAVARE